jgi:hypothetical protein
MNDFFNRNKRGGGFFVAKLGYVCLVSLTYLPGCFMFRVCLPASSFSAQFLFCSIRTEPASMLTPDDPTTHTYTTLPRSPQAAHRTPSSQVGKAGRPSIGLRAHTALAAPRRRATFLVAIGLFGYGSAAEEKHEVQASCARAANMQRPKRTPGMGLPTRMTTGGGGGDELIKIMIKTTRST